MNNIRSSDCGDDLVPPRVPLNEFILKVNSRCNLDCDYCYIYSAGDDSWTEQPRLMSPAIARLAGAAIAEHAATHDLPGVLVSLHGGEPLLGGIGHIDLVLRALTKELPDDLVVAFSMQTNGTLIDSEVASELARLGVRVGVSLDGPGWANDLHRRDFAGRSSHDAAVRGIVALQQHEGLLSGILSVIDLRTDPVELYDYIAGLGPPAVDFLLPHGSWMERPVGKDAAELQNRDAPAPYGEWLVTVFQRWLEHDPPRMRVRIFDDIIHLLLGGKLAFEGLGLAPSRLAVVETDGSFELVDHLKSVRARAGVTEMHVATHDLDTLLTHPGMIRAQLGRKALSKECRRCDVVQVCGGGLQTHRLHPVRGWAAPSVFCSDLKLLIDAISEELRQRLKGLPKGGRAGLAVQGGSQ